MTDRGNADRGLRIAEFGAALAKPVAATVPIALRFRIGRKTLTELLVPMRPQTAVAICPQYLKRDSAGTKVRNADCRISSRGIPWGGGALLATPGNNPACAEESEPNDA